MLSQFTYPVHLTGDHPNEWVVEFPDLPEAMTSGESLDDAYWAAVDCLEEAIAARIDDGEDIPEPSGIGPATFSVPLTIDMAMKAAVYVAMREQGLSKVKLAEKLNVNEKEARRIVDPHHRTRIQTLEKALRVLGKSLKVQCTELNMFHRSA